MVLEVERSCQCEQVLTYGYDMDISTSLATLLFAPVGKVAKADRHESIVLWWSIHVRGLYLRQL